MTRLESKFSELKNKNKKAFVSYIMAGDPDIGNNPKMMKGLVDNGVDVIELGMPFSDPMAEGPTIQKAAKRALENSVKTKDVIEVTKKFREEDESTPVILMGYFNPIFHYGIKQFIKDSEDAGVDGFIIVDLPPEEEEEVTEHLKGTDLSLIKLATPTTDAERAKLVLNNSRGFVYYVSVAGVTGVKEAAIDSVKGQINMLKKHTQLPVCVGFGIKTPEQAKELSENADGIVIGSAFVKIIESNLSDRTKAISECSSLAKKVRASLDS